MPPRRAFATFGCSSGAHSPPPPVPLPLCQPHVDYPTPLPHQRHTPPYPICLTGDCNVSARLILQRGWFYYYATTCRLPVAGNALPLPVGFAGRDAYRALCDSYCAVADVTTYLRYLPFVISPGPLFSPFWIKRFPLPCNVRSLPRARSHCFLPCRHMRTFYSCHYPGRAMLPLEQTRPYHHF